jgi:hypothetical protein
VKYGINLKKVKIGEKREVKREDGGDKVKIYKVR